MHVNNSGGEPTIVFLHGANAGAWMWNPVLDHMPDVHSLCPDLPGHGRSATEDWTTLEEIADDL
ncbi:MAG: alpha/beta fold hydrolase, partial [Pseudomonadota bacterium]